MTPKELAEKIKKAEAEATYKKYRRRGLSRETARIMAGIQRSSFCQDCVGGSVQKGLQEEWAAMDYWGK